MPVTVERAAENPLYLHILVYKTEAYWAQAMNAKQRVTNKQHANPRRAKPFIAKKMKRAHEHAQMLLNTARETLDEYSLFEVEAYAALTSGLFFIEKDQFEEALDHLLKAKVIYNKIASLKDTLEAIIYQEKVNQIDTFIRLCAAKLRTNAADIKMQGQEALEQSIGKAKQQVQMDKIEKIQEITFNGKSVPLKTEKIRAVFKKIEESMHALNNSDSQMATEERVKAYLQMVNLLDDSTLVIKKEKVEESKKSDASGQFYNILLSYVQKLKLQVMIDRNVLQAQHLASKMDIDMLLKQVGSNSKEAKMTLAGQQQVRPQNIVRFIEKALKAQRSVANAEKEAKDTLKLIENQFTEMYMETQIAFYIALHYALTKHYKSAYLIAQHCLQEIERVSEFADRNNLKHQKVSDQISLFQNTYVNQLNMMRVRCHVKLLAQQAEDHARVQSEFSAMQIDTNAEKDLVKQLKADNLYDVLFDNNGLPKLNQSTKLQITGDLNILDQEQQCVRAVDTGKPVVQVDKVKINKQFKLVDPLPKFQSVPATPQFFDLAGGYIAEYPGEDLAQEAAQYQVKQGFFSGLGSYFSRK